MPGQIWHRAEQTEAATSPSFSSRLTGGTRAWAHSTDICAQPPLGTAEGVLSVSAESDAKGQMPSSDLTRFLSAITVRESQWKFVTSAGADLSIGTPVAHVGLNGTVGAIWVKNGAKGATTRLNYAGAGGSAGLALIPSSGNFSFSMPQMPSSGKIYQLPFAGKTLSLNELKGAFILVGAGGDFGPGWAQSVMFLGGDVRIAGAIGAISGGFLQLPALIATSNACVRFGGMTSTVLPANVGLSAYIGQLG